MDDSINELLVSAARRLKGSQRRQFQAEVCTKLCDGSPRKAEQHFGWGRDTVAKGLRERSGESVALDSPAHRGRQRSEDANPQLAIDLRLIVEPHTQSDPELKSSRQYTNLSAGEVRQELLEKGYSEEELPSERTLRDVLNRMNYRLKRIQKGKPLKKTPDTDAIFDNVHAVHEAVKDDPETLEISVDTKAKVGLGEYVLGGKKPNRQPR
jgi:Rhodopirellula transposase DDE domain